MNNKTNKEDLLDRIKDLESQLLCIDQAVRKNNWTEALENCLKARTLISIKEVKAKATNDFKEELVQSVKPIFRPHIEGVCAVVLERINK